MSADRGSTNELGAAARELLGCTAWGLACGVGWHAIAAVGGHHGFMNDKVWLSFYAGSMASAIAAARWAPRIAGSLRLIAIGVVVGLTIAVLVKLDRVSGDLASYTAIVTLVTASLFVLRILLDLFARRWSPLARRAVAFVAAPFALTLMLFAMKTAQGGTFNLNNRDMVIVGAVAALGLAIVPPRRFEVPARD